MLTQQKAQFRRRETDAIGTHFAKLRDQNRSAAEETPLDLLRDIKRLNDHLVAGAAYPVLEASGELMPRASCFWVYAYPALLRYAAHSAGGYWARILPQASEIAS